VPSVLLDEKEGRGERRKEGGKKTGVDPSVVAARLHPFSPRLTTPPPVGYGTMSREGEKKKEGKEGEKENPLTYHLYGVSLHSCRERHRVAAARMTVRRKEKKGRGRKEKRKKTSTFSLTSSPAYQWTNLPI